MYEIDERELIAAHDAHPEYVSTRFAMELGCRRRIACQHHRAHVASVMAEHGELDRPVVGVALDGTGYGDDGSIWGFEVFTGSVLSGFRRVAHLRPARLPGGDAAARFPVQAAAGLLAEVDAPDLHLPPFCFPERYFQARALVQRNVRCYPTSSAGRLFDTVAAVCGYTREITYEGQAAIWLEQQARDAQACPPYPFPDLDPRPLLAAAVVDRQAGRDVREISHAFHAAVARSLLRTVCTFAQRISTRHVALSGGVFQNRLLRSMLEDREGEAGRLVLLYNETVPANDGGISLGQAALASVAEPESRRDS
jgi:hydrogenase maturation protein HypF